MLERWILLPLVAALIGWFTNYLAVRMIFRPRAPRRLGPLVLQGLLPKRRDEFARKIAVTVERHLFSAGDVRRALEHPEARAGLARLVDGALERFFREKLTARVPMLGAFLQGSMFEAVKEALAEELRQLMQNGVAVLGETLDATLDLEDLVARKIQSFDMDRLEGIVVDVAHRELRAIEILGGVLGFAVGVVQVLVLQWWERA